MTPIFLIEYQQIYLYIHLLYQDFCSINLSRGVPSMCSETKAHLLSTLVTAISFGILKSVPSSTLA